MPACLGFVRLAADHLPNPVGGRRGEDSDDREDDPTQEREPHQLEHETQEAADQEADDLHPDHEEDEEPSKTRDAPDHGMFLGQVNCRKQASIRSTFQKVSSVI